MSKVTLFVLSGLLYSSLACAETGLSPDDNPLQTYQLAMDYLLGQNGQPRQPGKAAALFKTLAEDNWRSAQHMLGNLYYQGKGVEKNDFLAYKWLSIAARRDINLARAIQHKRDILRQRLSQQNLHQVEKWIAEWKPDSRIN